MKFQNNKPKIIAWELTRKCSLACKHCRAFTNSTLNTQSSELPIEKCFDIIDQIKSYEEEATLILTGGDPLLRNEIFEIGLLIDKDVIKKIKASGIQLVSMSLDGSSAFTHDEFRGIQGAFHKTLETVKLCIDNGIEIQLNTTLTRSNKDEIGQIIKLGENLKIKSHHIFIIVPVGKARKLQHEDLLPAEYEAILSSIGYAMINSPVRIRPICAPYFMRIMKQKFKNFELKRFSKGCIAGISYCFISYDGIVSPCGYFEINCGDLKIDDFKNIWENSEVFKKLRERKLYKGKCGKCEFLNLCGGCRARALAKTGDFLSEDPICSYVHTP